MQLKLTDLLEKAEKEILIIGVLPIEEEIVDKIGIKEIVENFHTKADFKLSIYHESENDLFVSSLYLDTKQSNKRISFKELKNKIQRIDRLERSYLSVEAENKGYDKNLFIERLKIRQLNFRHSVNIVKIDEKIYISEVLLDIQNEYREISNDEEKNQINYYIDFITAEKKGGIYLSEPDDELIEMYDKDDIPRGIFPRRAFYNTDFQRYSVWVFVFNRKGQIMLHQRADKKYVKDNAGLWDKSAGGHVDLKDRSSNEAAEREIIEEMYLADAEYTKYLRGNTDNFINLGEWLEEVREGEKVMNLFARLKPEKWGYFSLKPSVKRVSKRRFIELINEKQYEDEKQKPKLVYSKTDKEYIETDYVSPSKNENFVISFKDTKFISDIFLFISPDNEINNKDDLNNIPSKAAKARRLMDVRKFLEWVEVEKESGNAENIFTDDLIYIADTYKDTLLGFAEYMKFSFKKENTEDIIDSKYQNPDAK